MSLKPTTLASMLMALAGILSIVGCSGDECTKAADHFTECMSLNASTSSGGLDPSAQCDGVQLCISQCINARSCDDITGAFTDSSSEGSVKYRKCSTDCTTK